MIEPERAAVAPRVWAPGGSTLLLEDVVRDLHAELGGRGTLLLRAGPRAGKTTALAHLAAVLPADLGVVLADLAPAADEHLRQPREGLQVLLYPSRQRRAAWSLPWLRVLDLAAWDRDSCIEYLLARHPEKCASVMQRFLAAPDRALLGGHAELHAVVLDHLAADPAADLIAMALYAHLRALFGDEEQWRRECEWAARHLGTDSVGNLRVPLLGLWVPKLLMAAQAVADELSRGSHSLLLAGVPHDVLAAAGSMLRARPASLAMLFAGAADADVATQAARATVYFAADPTWRPPPGWRELPRARLDHAQWRGIELARARLRAAHLRDADLTGADLAHADLCMARLERARLDGAVLRGADLTSARLAEASLTGADAKGANLRYADLNRARLERACLASVRLQHADLRGASCAGADFAGADLRHACIADADFAGARLERIDGTALQFSATRLVGAILRGAKLGQARLEGQDLNDVDLGGADLQRADLTGSRGRRLGLRAANLRETGLAEVDWEGSDLRDADLSFASFHLGSSRSGLVGSTIASEGTRLGFYTDEFHEQGFRAPEEIRKANLRAADLRGARLIDTDLYLVDLREARMDPEQRAHAVACRAILT